MTAIRPGRDIWETNFVPDLGAFALKPWEAHGVGSSNIQFLMSEGSMGAHVSEMPVGTYKKAHRHGAGLHVFFIHGTGYTLLWNEGDRDFQRVDWRHGMCFAPPDNMFHQHFDTSPRAARYVAVGFGSKRYPVIWDRRVGSEGKRTDVSIKDGGRPDRVRRPGPAHPRALARRVAQDRRRVADGAVFRRAASGAVNRLKMPGGAK